MRNSQTILEFDVVLNKIATFSVSAKARAKILNLEIQTDFELIKQQLELVDQAIKITYSFGPIPLEAIHDITAPLEIALKDGILSVEQLYHISAQDFTIKKILNYQKMVKFDSSPLIKRIIDQLQLLPILKNEFDRCISPNLTLNDHASPELFRIRKEIIKKESEVRRKLESYLAKHSELLSDSIITIRNERLVIPIKAAYKFKFGGIIHDQSDSGQTFYVEPEDVVLINAQLSSLRFQESDEIEKILFGLSQMVKANYDAISLNFDLLTSLDFIFAKAKYAKENNAMVATLSPTQSLELINARHPLLDKKKVVANNFYLGGAEQKIVLITGPNTGGKTVALKTVGLLAMMNQAGLPITVDSKAILPIFNAFFVDIGDDQSIQHELSTFSSHLTKLIEIIDEVDAKSLVLVDELGGGTDPRQGEALAMTILEYFNKQQALVMATTHYYNLKTFAIQSGYITNASMAFDESKIIPTYKLKYGVAGKSYAFEISEKLGFRNELIRRAKDYYQKFENESDLLIKKLESEVLSYDQKISEISNQQHQIEQEKAEIIKAKEAILKQRESLKEKAQEQVEEMVYEALEKIEDIVKQITSQPSEDLKMHQWIEAKAQLQGLLNKEEKKTIVINQSLSINDVVYVPKLRKNGTIIRVNKDQTYLVGVGNVSLELSGNELEKVEEKQQQPKVMFKTSRGISNLSLELNLIGQRVDEAMVNLRKYLDSARVAHYQSVRIIHGFGTGALRNAVHEYLDSQKYIKDYRLGGESEGGHGATVVTLK
jgi:DNA mismatch repair protein MutS2